jgi:hypothetical protein
MKDYNITMFLKMIVVIFIMSLIITLTIKYPSFDSSYDLGYSTGLLFIQAIKVLGTIGLIVFAIRTIRTRGVRTIE